MGEVVDAAVKALTFMMLIAGLLAGPGKAQSSLTVFTAASKFCEKARLGMQPITAYERAVDYVRSNRFFEPDYTLPHWKRVVSNEMNRLCPVEYNKLLNEYDSRAKAAAAEASAKAAEKARWDALPEETKAAHKEREKIRQKELNARYELENLKEKQKEYELHESRRFDYCAKKCDHCLRVLSKRKSWCSNYLSEFFPYQGIYPNLGSYSCSCDS